MADNWPTVGIRPSIRSTLQNTAKSRFLELGDGYAQVGTDGINPVRKSMKFVYEFLTESDFSTLYTFSIDRIGTGARVTVPVYHIDLSGNTTATFIIQNVTPKRPEGTLPGIEVEFLEVFGE